MKYVATKGSTFKVTAGTWSGVGTIGSSTILVTSSLGGSGSLTASYTYSDYCKIDGQSVVYSILASGTLFEQVGSDSRTTVVSLTLNGSTKYVKDGSSWLLEGDSSSSSVTTTVITQTPTGPSPPVTVPGTQKISIETTQTNTKAE